MQPKPNVVKSTKETLQTQLDGLLLVYNVTDQ